MARILIIDDDAGIRGVLRRILVRQGYDVEEAADVFLIKLSEVAPDVPAIAISGGGSFGTATVLEDAERLGAAATLEKPFTPDDVRRVLSEVLRGGGGGAP